MSVDRTEFTLWKRSEFYRDLEFAIREKMQNLANEILNRGQPEGNRDMYVRGALHAFTEVLEYEPKYFEEEGDLPEDSNGEA